MFILEVEGKGLPPVGNAGVVIAAGIVIIIVMVIVFVKVKKKKSKITDENAYNFW